MFGKTMGYREEFEQTGPGQLPPASTLTLFVVISGDSSLPGPGSLSEFFQTVKEEVKNISWVCWALIFFSLK